MRSGNISLDLKPLHISCTIYHQFVRGLTLLIGFFYLTALSAAPKPPVKISLAVKIQKKLKKLAQTAPSPRNQLGIYIQSVKTGRMLYALNPDLPLNPASCIKILTSIAALHYLGSAYRFPTEAYTDLFNRQTGNIHHLFIKGYGDPKFVSEQLFRLVNDLQAIGVKQVMGDIIIDNTYFDGQEIAPAFNQKITDDAYRAMISATSLNFNAAEIKVFPTQIGHKPQVFINAGSRYLILHNQAQTINSHGVNLLVQTSPAGNQTKVDISGWIGLHHPGLVRYKMIYHPNLYAGNALRVYLKKWGILVKGQVRPGTVPATAKRLLRQESLPLSVYLKDINKFSNNFMTEQVIKAIGAQVYGIPGTWAKGIKALQIFLKNLVGIPPQRYTLTNGSGLFNANRFSARDFVTLLAYIYRHHYTYAEFLTALSINGTDGTLRARIPGYLYRGTIRGKTGTLNEVSGIIGYVASKNSDLYAFAIVMNQLSTWDGVFAFQDRILKTLILGTFE